MSRYDSKAPTRVGHGELSGQSRTSPRAALIRRVRYASATAALASIMLGSGVTRANAAIDAGNRYFVLWPHVYQDVVQNWHVDFVPTSERDYAYQIQIAGEDDELHPKLACDKLEANHYRSLALKDINVEFGVGSDKKVSGKVTAGAQSVDIFGGWYNRFSLTGAVTIQTHLRVAVYNTRGVLQYTTRWFDAPEADILAWKWPRECAWVTIAKQ